MARGAFGYHSPVTHSRTALILFAHGARDPRWAEPFHAMREAIRRRLPSARVELAFLEIMSPSLDQAVDAAEAAGARHIVVIPAFMGQGGHLRRDLPALIAGVQARHPHCTIIQAPAIGEAPEVVEAVAAFAIRQALGR